MSLSWFACVFKEFYISSLGLQRHFIPKGLLCLCACTDRADTSPIWSMAWCPGGGACESVDDLQAHTFMTLPHSGICKIWDVRCMGLCIPRGGQGRGLFCTTCRIVQGADALNQRSSLEVRR